MSTCATYRKRFPCALQTTRHGISQGCKGCTPAPGELALVGLATSTLVPRFTSQLGTPGHAGVSPCARTHVAAVFTNMTPQLLRAVMKESANATSRVRGWPRSPALGANSEALGLNAGSESTLGVRGRWFCSQTVLKYHCHHERVFHRKLKIAAIN